MIVNRLICQKLSLFAKILRTLLEIPCRISPQAKVYMVSLHGKTDIPHESWDISILNCDFDFILLKIPIILTMDFNYFSPLLGINFKVKVLVV